MGGVTGPEPEQLREVTRRIDRATIRLYAEVSTDFNPLHLDPDFAAATPMGGIVAHGMLSLALLWQSLQASFGTAAMHGITVDVRFLKPVREDDRITAGGRRAAPARYEVWVKNQAGDTLVAGTATLAAA